MSKIVPLQPYLDERDYQARIEWADEQTHELFVKATVRAHDTYNARMQAARGCVGDAWKRRREAAKAEFQAATKEAHDLCERTEEWFIAHGNPQLPDELDALWTDLINRERVAGAMSEAAE